MAADVSARVHLVAEKLQQKAQDAQRKGNDAAARALSSSVSDLRQAMALISEQRHLLARRRGEGDEEEDDADAHVQELATRLARVEAMLDKKSEDMKNKGNENAAAALQQSAATVDKGRALLMEQQQTIFGLLGRWEKLQDVVEGKTPRRRSSVATSDGEETEEDKEQDTAHGRLIARVRHLVQLGGMLAEVFPECKEVGEVREEMERGRRELADAREEAAEVNEMLKQESLALEEVKKEVERMKEKEVVRQEEDAALLEQQREACQAMEQLVRESDQEIQRMTQSAATQAEEMQSLRIEIESLVSEKERLVRVHTDEVEELQGQLESAMDALSSKTDESAAAGAEELQALQTKLESLNSEKEELVKAHADEVEELRRQIEKATASLSVELEESASSNAEELQSLQAALDKITSEKEGMARLHTEEIEELRKSHTVEIEKLRQQLDNAVNTISKKTEESESFDPDELHALQTKVDGLISEKEEIAKLHEDEVEDLRKAHADEVKDLRRKLENAIASASANAEKSDADNAEELRLLRDEVDTLISEKEDLAEIHASELEKLRETHLAEMEGLHQQLDNATADLSAKTTDTTLTNIDELEQLRAAVGALTIEKDHLVKEHADKIEKLNHQLMSAKADTQDVSSGQEMPGANEDEAGESGENVDVPVLEFEEEGSQPIHIAAEDEVRASSNGAGDASDVKTAAEMQTALDGLQTQLVAYEERSQAQQDAIAKLEQEQAELQKQLESIASDKIQAVKDLQRAHEAKSLKMQASLDTLQTQVAECEDGRQTLQSTITSLEKEKVELQEQIERLTNAVEELRSTHGEETTRLVERLASSESQLDMLSAQLEEAKETLAAKSAEQRATADVLERCEAELVSCRSELEAQIRKCSQLKNDLEVAQDAEDAKSGEIGERLSRLTSELREIVVALRPIGKLDAETTRSFAEKVWQSQEASELCGGIAPLLADLVSAQDQLRATTEQLELTRSNFDNQKQVLDQFVKTADWRLFAKDGEVEGEVVEALSDRDVGENLAVAKSNLLRWLDELQQLRDRVDKDTAHVDELEQEKLQAQECFVALEDSKRDLEVLTESLKEQLAVMRSEKENMAKFAENLKAQNHSASIQEQQQQAAKQEEVAELQQQLASVRSDFEKYRVRSHTALKKMEKRAELLNGMRKENEELLKQVKESDEQRDQAEMARKNSEARLEEVQRTQEMMQADFDQFAVEKARVIDELEEEVQRLVSEREQTDAKIQELTIRIQELETEKKKVEEENERIKEAEQAAFQARLNTATDAVQAAKQDLQKVNGALEASKTETEKRQKLIESLELKLEQYTTKTPSADDTNGASPATHTPVSYVSPLAPTSGDANRNVAELEKELRTLRASEHALRKQLDDARAELIALQERFATTKAANAEKVFALEEQSNHWKMELAATTEEVRHLNTVLEAQASTTSQPLVTNGTLSAPEVICQQQHEKAEVNTTRMQELSEEIRVLKTELADANTEITLLTRALDASREELRGAQNQIDALTLSSSEPESGEDSSAVSKTAAALLVKDEALKKLRVQVLELQEELQTVRDEKAALELEHEKEELDELQATRKALQSEKERAMQLQRRQTLVSSFEKQVSTIVDELQHRLEDHSSAFREVCDFRDEHRAALLTDGDGSDITPKAEGKTGEPEFEECLVMRSGVVIKAGASFQLPVICEKRGWRVVWNFSVKEDAADVSFKLSAMMADAASTEVEVVSPERMNEMSGVFKVQQDNTTLVFEWDNSFSWLNEKTLDYHVSIQEPLTPQAQKVRHSERGLQTKAKLLEDGLALIQAETQRRSELSATLERLSECEANKNKHLEEFGARKTEVLEQKAHFQEEMDAQKAAFSAMLQEQDELEDIERGIARVWQAAVAEREDVEMTLQLAGNGAQLETLAREMEERAKSVADQLKNPIGEDVEAESSKAEKVVLSDDHNEAAQGYDKTDSVRAEEDDTSARQQGDSVVSKDEAEAKQEQEQSRE